MKFDILSIQEKTLTVKAEAGRISARKNAVIERTGARRFENGKLFQASRLGAVTDDQMLTDTREFGGPGTPHDFGFAPARIEKRQSRVLGEESIRAFEEGLQELNRQHPDFVFSGRCAVENASVALRSSYGLDLSASGGACSWYYVYQRKGSSNMLDGYFGATTDHADIQGAIREHSRYLKAQGTECKLSAGRMPVLFVDPLQPLQKLIDSFRINKYREGAALFSGKLGEKLFSDKVTLLDTAYDPAQGQLQFFDGEGVVRSQDSLKLVDQGRFASVISDLRFGKKYGHESTGNGLRPYNRGVSLMLRSPRFAKGDKPWQEIAKGLDRCLVAMVSAGGDSNDMGDFSAPVQVGYILERGQVVGRAPQLTVKTSVSRYLGADLIGVAADGFTADDASAALISEMEVFL